MEKEITLTEKNKDRKKEKSKGTIREKRERQAIRQIYKEKDRRPTEEMIERTKERSMQ